MYEKLETYLSKERLNKYLELADGNKEKAIKLYELNLNISESFYILLSYFEVFLRNFCNNKLIEEVGENWFDTKILNGNNKNKGQWAINKIEETKEKIKKRKKEKKIINYIPTNTDIISNLELSFWTNLFCVNYEFTIWIPYLRNIFYGFNRKNFFKIIDSIRELRNRIFHYEPIIFDKKIKEKYDNIISIVCFISNQETCDYIENNCNFNTIYDKLKNSGVY